MATPSRGERLRYRYGICLNDNCSKCKSKEVQQIAARKELVCEECGKPLRECPPPKTGPSKKLIMTIGAVVVAFLVVLGIIFIPRGESNTDTTDINDTIVTPPVVVDTPTVAKPEEPVKVNPVPPVNGRGTVNLGYGKYTGDLKNGKPHGWGTVTYTKSTKIVNSKDFVANPGDTFEGEFRDGKISGQGYWTHDGNQTVVKP